MQQTVFEGAMDKLGFPLMKKCRLRNAQCSKIHDIQPEHHKKLMISDLLCSFQLNVKNGRYAHVLQVLGVVKLKISILLP